MEFFEALWDSAASEDVMVALYGNPWTCQAIFGSLPAFGKLVVSRLICVGEAANYELPAEIVLSWVVPEKRSEATAILARLCRLRILVASEAREAPGVIARPGWNVGGKVALNSTFCAQFFRYICDERCLQYDGAVSAVGEGVSEIDAPVVPLKVLEDYVATQWQKFVLFVRVCDRFPGATVAVGYIERPVLADGQIDLLVASGLLSRSVLKKKGEEELATTPAGFRFLLRSLRAQVWTVLLQYSQGSTARGLDRTEVLAFLFQLGCDAPGVPQPVSSLNSTQRIVLSDLAAFGFVLQPEGRRDVYYATPLTAHLAAAPPDDDCEADELDVLQEDTEGFCILETNFRLCASTSEVLPLSLLSLFTRFQYRLPGLMVGILTRESVRRALKRGIGAEQVLKYLRVHAHPQMRLASRRGAVPLLPDSVCTQVRLWEAEMNRLDAQDGVLFVGFPTHHVFLDAVSFCSARKALLWQSDSRELLFVQPGDGVPDALKDFLKSRQSTVP